MTHQHSCTLTLNVLVNEIEYRFITCFASRIIYLPGVTMVAYLASFLFFCRLSINLKAVDKFMILQFLYLPRRMFLSLTSPLLNVACAIYLSGKVICPVASK